MGCTRFPQVFHMFDGYKARKEVRELREELERLKRRLDLMEVAWTELLDRVKHMMGRIEKRAAVAVQSAEASVATLSPAASLSTLSPRARSMLSSVPGPDEIRRAKVQEEILARRNRGRVPQTSDIPTDGKGE